MALTPAERARRYREKKAAVAAGMKPVLWKLNNPSPRGEIARARFLSAFSLRVAAGGAAHELQQLGVTVLLPTGRTWRRRRQHALNYVNVSTPERKCIGEPE
jgi:hypothetical protein